MLRRRGLHVARKGAGRLQGGDGEFPPALGRPDDEHAVGLGIDLCEQPAEQGVGILEGGGSQVVELHGVGDAFVATQAREVGRFDEDDALRLVLRPHAAERVEDPIGIRPDTERRSSIGDEQIRGHLTVGYDAVAVDERERGLAVAELEPGTIDAVGVGDHATTDVVACELVGHRTELDVVRQSVVFSYERRETERHDRTGGVRAELASGAPFEDLAGRGGADELVGVELVAVDADHSDRPRARTEGDVPVGGAGLVRDDARRCEARERAVGEEALQVGGVDGVELGPGRAREREDEQALHGVRLGGGRGPGNEAAAQHRAHQRERDEREAAPHLGPTRPSASNARNGADPFDQPTEGHDLGGEIGDEQHGRDRDAGRRRRGEHEREAEDRAEDVGAGVTEHQPFPQIVAEQCERGSGDDRQRDADVPGAAHERDRDVADQARTSSSCLVRGRAGWPGSPPSATSAASTNTCAPLSAGPTDASTSARAPPPTSLHSPVVMRPCRNAPRWPRNPRAPAPPN